MVTPANSSPTSAFGRTIPPDSGSADARKDRQTALAAQKQKKLDDAARKEADQNKKKERERIARKEKKEMERLNGLEAERLEALRLKTMEEETEARAKSQREEAERLEMEAAMELNALSKDTRGEAAKKNMTEVEDEAKEAAKRKQQQRENEMADEDDDEEALRESSRRRVGGTPTKGTAGKGADNDNPGADHMDAVLLDSTPPRKSILSNRNEIPPTKPLATATAKPTPGTHLKSRGSKRGSTASKKGGIAWSDVTKGNGRKDQPKVGKEAPLQKSTMGGGKKVSSSKSSTGETNNTAGNEGDKEGKEGSKEEKIPAYDHTGYIELSVWVPQGTPKAEVRGTWEDIIADGLEALQMNDPSVCILREDDLDDQERIYGKQDMPDRFKQWRNFIKAENENVLGMAAPKDKKRKIVCSVKMGFKEDPKQFLSDSLVDLAQVDGIQFFYKHIQALDTSRKLMLMYAPNSVPMDTYASEVQKLLEAREKEWTVKNPHLWDKRVHSGEFPEIKCILDWGRGTKWEERKAGAPNEDTTHRKVPTFLYATKHEERIMALVKECKRRGLEKGIFGEHAFFQEVPGRDAPDAQKVRYAIMLCNHGAVQKSLGQVSLEGLVDIDKKITAELMPDESGPRQSPGSYSVRDLMMKMKAGDAKLWQGIFRGRNGTWYGYFPGTDPAATSRAKTFAKDLASELKIFLIKQGWVFSNVKALIAKSFSSEAADNASKAKWCKKSQRVIGGADIVFQEHNNTLEASFIDTKQAHTDWERANLEAAMKTGAAEVTMPAFAPGSFGAFDFSGDQSVTSLRTRTSTGGRTAQTYQFGETSIYSIEEDAELGFGNDGDEDEEMSDGDNGKMEFEMPSEGIDSTKNVTAGSIQSPCNPNNLATSFASAEDSTIRGDEDAMDEESGEEDQREQPNTTANETNSNNNESAQTAAFAGQSVQEMMMMMKKEMDALKLQLSKVTTEKDIMAAQIAQVDNRPPMTKVLTILTSKDATVTNETVNESDIPSSTSQRPATSQQGHENTTPPVAEASEAEKSGNDPIRSG